MAKHPKPKRESQYVLSFPVDAGNANIRSKINALEGCNNQEQSSSGNPVNDTINDAKRSSIGDISERVLRELTEINPIFSVAVKVLGKVGSFLRGKRFASDIIANKLDPNLEEDCNQTAGGSSFVAAVIAWLATNQTIVYFTKPLKWIGITKVLGILAYPLQ